MLVRPVPADRVRTRSRPDQRLRTALGSRIVRVALLGTAVLALVLLPVWEVRTSRLQALLFTTIDKRLRFSVESGPGQLLDAPRGPYDIRLGYSALPELVEHARSAGFAVEAQARSSPWLGTLVGRGVFPIYHEKSRAGLVIADREGRPLYTARYPERAWEDFAAIPPVVVNTLLFIENRDLLDPDRPRLNPAVEWARLAKAVGLEMASRVGRHGQVIGASTLATQLEKFRHSPDGRTRSARDKLQQMISASLRTYQDGPRTLGARRQIVLDYVNSMPLAAVAGHGEVLGLGDGLWVWYGMDFAAATRELGGASDAAADGRTYKRTLALILAARRPYFYLTENRPALEELANRYLRALARGGVIGARLRDLALGETLGFESPLPPAGADWTDKKGANIVRARLTGLLDMPALYDVDRLDLTAHSALDGPTQDAVSRTLQSLRSPETITRLGLRGFHLLERGDPSRVIYSFTLYERGPRGNHVRLQTDSLDQPLDINAGARLDLGSTAKLRTLITYLEAIAALHERFTRAAPSPAEVHPKDRLGAWAAEYLARTPGASLSQMLEASMERKYSASPAEFVTGGGLQTFHNFDNEDDGRIVTVATAFRHSVNLPFIRIMRDIVDHVLYAPPTSLARVLEDPDDPRRQEYLARFADREGSEFTRRFYRKYQDKTPEQALEQVLGSTRQAPRSLAATLRSVDPGADLATFRAVLEARLPGLGVPDRVVASAFEQQGPAALSLVDRGYVARVHPLELWVVAYLRQHPKADMAEVLSASAVERQTVYGWLFKTQRRHAQDKRIRSLLEMQAFLEIQRSWQRLGYPFATVTPSLAAAIGSSGDRPAALARLMGIIVNDGVSRPSILIDRLDFATGTPYETRLGRGDSEDGEQVLAPEICRVVRGALTGVVTEGTAQALRQVLERPGGPRHMVGGKTGTGDHRYDTFAPGGRLIHSRVVDRAATFVFLIDDRFFGTVTAYVPGPEAARYEFTSALPVRLLGILMPELSPLLDSRPAAPPTRTSAAR